MVILRRAAKSNVALTRNSAEGQMELLLPDQDVELWEYAVLVSNSRCPLESMAQLHRERADVGNGFDELKNQWGRGGLRLSTSNAAGAALDPWPWTTGGVALSSGQSASRDGGRYRQGVVAGRRGPSHQTSRQDGALPDPDARGQDKPDALDRQYPSGSQPCQKGCGVVSCQNKWKTMLDYIVDKIIPLRPRRLLRTWKFWLVTAGLG